MQLNKHFLIKVDPLQRAFFSVIFQNHTQVCIFSEQIVVEIILELFKKIFWHKPLYGKFTTIFLQTIFQRGD